MESCTDNPKLITSDSLYIHSYKYYATTGGKVPRKGWGSPLQSLLSIDLDLTPYRRCPPIEDPPTMVSASPCNLTHYWGKVFNPWDLWIRRWALLSAHLRGLLSPPPVFIASGEDTLVSVMDPPGQGPPTGPCLLWSYATYLYGVPLLPPGDTLIGLGEAPKEQ